MANIKAAVGDALYEAIAEGGPELASSLDNYVTELNARTIDTQELEPLVFEAMRGMGTVSTLAMAGKRLTYFRLAWAPLVRCPSPLRRYDDRPSG